MAVYVDAMRPCLKSKLWPWSHACHMFADSKEELIEFALKIGLKRHYLQNRPGFIHFDLTFGMRAAAIRAGAQPLTDKEFLAYRGSKLNAKKKKSKNKSAATKA